MDDETLPPEGTEPVDAPVEQQPDPQEAPEANEQPSEVEQIARDLGWRPKEEFKGDEAAWKDPVEFIRAGKDIQSGMSKELKAMRETLDNVSRTSATIMQQELARQRADLEARYEQAFVEGDATAAQQIQQQIGRIDQAAVAPTAPEVNDFVKRNPWFNSDPLARDLAIQTADRLAKQGYGAAEQVKAAEREVRRFYPEHFAQAQPAARVAEPASRATPARSSAKGFHSLPPAAQKIARDMVERGLLPSTDAYVANYFKDQGK